MKKIFLLLSLCFCLSGCTSILLGIAIVSASEPSMTFKAAGETFEAKGDNVATFRIFEVEGKGFAISHVGSAWDTENTLEELQIGLNCGFFDGKLKKREEYVFTEDDRLDVYPVLKYTKSENVESTSESSVSRLTTVWLNASDGWFKITKFDKNDGTVSGKFAFTAVCDDPASDEVIEITDGFFKNVPYILIQDND